MAALIGVVLWLTVGQSGGSSSGANGVVKPVAVSAAGLRTLATVVPSPIYWAGPLPRMRYELSRTTAGGVYVRYLPKGVHAGAKARYLTIATYPVANAFAVTQRAARLKRAVPIAAGSGTVAFYNASRPQSIFYAQSGSEYQVEVYSPSAGQARQLVSSGQVVPAGGNAQGNAARPTAASAQKLRLLAGTLGHPFYWLGAKPGYTYELTRTPNRSIFVRYLPHGVAVGARTPYLTVATYPLAGALQAVERAASQTGSAKIKLARGGIAVVDAGYPKSIHLAFPGSSYQVEVFDPSPARALQVVTSGQVTQVPAGG